MFERLTDRARKVMALANQEAQRFNHEYIGTEHILLGLVKEASGVGANVLKNLGIDLRKVRLEVEKLVKSGPEMVTMGKLPQTPRAKKVLEYAIEEARNLNHNYVGTEHLLLGLLREQDGVAAQVLVNLGLKLEEVREEVLNLLGAGGEQEEEQPQNPAEAQGEQAPGAEREGGPRRTAKSKTPALDSFSVTTDDGIKLVIARQFRQVAAERIQSRGLALRCSSRTTFAFCTRRLFALSFCWRLWLFFFWVATCAEQVENFFTNFF